VADTREIDALGHALGEWEVTTAATCTVVGVQTRTCTREDCDFFETETITATGHAWGRWQVTSEATCTSDGTEVRLCTNSGCNQRRTQTIDATGHNFGGWEVTTAAAVGTDGVETRTCSDCGYAETRSIDALTPDGDDAAGDDDDDAATDDDDDDDDVEDDIGDDDDDVADVGTDTGTGVGAGDTGTGDTGTGTDIVTPTPGPAAIDDNVILSLLAADAPVIRLADISGSVISADVLQAIKESGKDVEVVLANGFSFTIVADSIQDGAQAFDLNIDVIITERATTIEGSRVPANSIVIIPSTTGAFGFDILFSVTAAQLAEAGLNGNNVKLWYVNHAGVVTDMGRARLLADGSVEFIISHASFYVLSEDAPLGVDPTDVNVPTGVALGLAAAVLAGGALVVSRRRK